ncbi:hypothetical protein OLK001_05330 [Synechocystis sp. LKSZ1]
MVSRDEDGRKRTGGLTTDFQLIIDRAFWGLSASLPGAQLPLEPQEFVYNCDTELGEIISLSPCVRLNGPVPDPRKTTNRPIPTLGQ